MGGNDTHDKYGRPYELNDEAEIIFDKLELVRGEIDYLKFEIQEFKEYLEKEMQELESSTNIEFAQTNEIYKNFMKILGQP